MCLQWRRCSNQTNLSVALQQLNIPRHPAMPDTWQPGDPEIFLLKTFHHKNSEKNPKIGNKSKKIYISEEEKNKRFLKIQNTTFFSLSKIQKISKIQSFFHRWISDSSFCIRNIAIRSFFLWWERAGIEHSSGRIMCCHIDFSGRKPMQTANKKVFKTFADLEIKLGWRKVGQLLSIRNNSRRRVDCKKHLKLLGSLLIVLLHLMEEKN